MVQTLAKPLTLEAFLTMDATGEIANAVSIAPGWIIEIRLSDQDYKLHVPDWAVGLELMVGERLNWLVE